MARRLPPIAPSDATAILKPAPNGKIASALADRLLANGQRHLEQGNIQAARAFFQRAADAGSAEAALALGATYDPGQHARLSLLGVRPDRAEARRWYLRAREMGSPEAEARLVRLGP